MVMEQVKACHRTPRHRKKLGFDGTIEGEIGWWSRLFLETLRVLPLTGAHMADHLYPDGEGEVWGRTPICQWSLCSSEQHRSRAAAGVRAHGGTEEVRNCTWRSQSPY